MDTEKSKNIMAYIGTSLAILLVISFFTFIFIREPIVGIAIFISIFGIALFFFMCWSIIRVVDIWLHDFLHEHRS